MFRLANLLHTVFAIGFTIYIIAYWNKNLTTDRTDLKMAVRRAIYEQYSDMDSLVVHNDSSSPNTTTRSITYQMHAHHRCSLTIVLICVVSTAALYASVVVGAALNKRAAIRYDFQCRETIGVIRQRDSGYIASIVYVRAMTMVLGCSVALIGALLFGTACYIVATLLREYERYVRCQSHFAILASWAFVLLLCAIDFTLRTMPRVNKQINDIERCRRAGDLAEAAARRVIRESTSSIYKPTVTEADSDEKNDDDGDDDGDYDGYDVDYANDDFYNENDDVESENDGVESDRKTNTDVIVKDVRRRAIQDANRVARTMTSIRRSINCELETVARSQHVSMRMRLEHADVYGKDSRGSLCCDFSRVINWVSYVTLLWWPCIIVYFIGLEAGRWTPI